MVKSRSVVRARFLQAGSTAVKYRTQRDQLVAGVISANRIPALARFCRDFSCIYLQWEVSMVLPGILYLDRSTPLKV